MKEDCSFKKKVLQTRDLTFYWQIPVIFFKKCLSGFFLAWDLNCSELPGAVWPGSTIGSAVCTYDSSHP